MSVDDLTKFIYTCPKCGWSGKEGEQQLWAGWGMDCNEDICPVCWEEDVDEAILLDVEVFP